MKKLHAFFSNLARLSMALMLAATGCKTTVNNGGAADANPRATDANVAAADGNRTHADANPLAPDANRTLADANALAPDAPIDIADAAAAGEMTADDGIAPYNGLFSYGSNLGYFGGQWSNNQLANLLIGGGDGQAGVGVKSVRGALFDDFLKTYGNTINVPNYQYYASLDASEHVVFINEVGQQTNDQDTNSYDGCTSPSQFQKNMYLPIFVSDGNGGQKVNPDNYLAQYVYTVVSTYKNLGIRFYEVYNEPDFTYNFVASSEPGTQGYWGDNNPLPCDLSNTNAPISHHVRLHRVIYEVVHATDPTAFVATGGIGYSSYLDALLRNTDNPGSYEQNAGEGDGTIEGAVSTRYPKGGGAYFDVLSFHSYPQYDLNVYAGSASDCITTAGVGGRYDAPDQRCYFEHSDAAVSDTLAKQTAMQSELTKFGYDGISKPLKHFILTETNVPRVPAAYANGSVLSTTIQQWGGTDYAKNYIAKMLVLAQKNAIRQVYIYSSSDEVNEDGTDCTGTMQGTDDTKIEGMFHDLACINPYDVVPTVQATVYTTMSSHLYGFSYDATETAKLALPSTLDGAAFSDGMGHERYALWVKTTTDRSETASASYAFPSGTAAGSTVTLYAWDASSSGSSTTSSRASVPLTASPIIVE